MEESEEGEPSKSSSTESSAIISDKRTGKHAYELMLEEIWENVFDWLTDPDDLTSCLYVCKAFNKLLKEKRTTFMFAQVFQIITKNTITKKSDHVDMLVCRTVSKVWKQGVDDHYQNLSYFSELDYCAFDEEAMKCISAFLIRIWNDPFSIDFELGPRDLPVLKRKLIQWTSIPDKSAANPFPSRHLAIYDTEDTLRDDMDGLIENAEMKEKVKEMLENFGHQVWYLTILLHMNIPSERYLLLLEWLKFTPNLKALSIYFRAGDENCEEIVEQHPFPEMSQLTMFQGDKMPNSILKSVLRSNPQIEKVQNQGAPSLFPFQQPKLAEIRAKSREMDKLQMNTARFSKLEKLQVDFPCTTKKFIEYRNSVVHCYEENNREICEIQFWNVKSEEKAVFTMLKRFENTLVHFRLGILENSPKPGPLTLKAITIDLILPLRAWNLKTLRITAKCRDGYRWVDEKGVTCQLLTYLQGRLDEAKIWKLPEVKQVFVVDGCDGYLTLFV